MENQRLVPGPVTRSGRAQSRDATSKSASGARLVESQRAWLARPPTPSTLEHLKANGIRRDRARFSFRSDLDLDLRPAVLSKSVSNAMPASVVVKQQPFGHPSCVEFAASRRWSVSRALARERLSASSIHALRALRGPCALATSRWLTR